MKGCAVILNMEGEKAQNRLAGPYSSRWNEKQDTQELKCLSNANSGPTPLKLQCAIENILKVVLLLWYNEESFLNRLDNSMWFSHVELVYPTSPVSAGTGSWTLSLCGLMFS